MLNYRRYKRAPAVDFPECTWPSKEIMRAPIRCSVDLRDGDQVLVESMVMEEKVETFGLPAKLDFKETKVGLSAVSQIKYDFLRILVERKLIPDDVKVQVLVQCCKHLIKRTFEVLEGVKKAIVRIYNSMSALQRDVTFHEDKEDIKGVVVIDTKMVQRYVADCDIQIRLKYSPESFTGTGPDFALDICTAVQETQDATKEKPIAINLLSTVEMTTPNVYADRIEWMNTHFKDRENTILSIHPCNGKGEGVAPTKLALPAGADRVEDTLFDNGKRTGNMDILTVTYNMLSQGIDPELNIENIREIAEVCERCTKAGIPPRRPYADKLVFATLSDSRQDVINKGMQVLYERSGQHWRAPYLPIDLGDIGKEYEPIVRINNQSGKGGVVSVVDTSYGLKLPKGMYKEFADVIQRISEQQGEVAPEQIMDGFKKNYLECKESMHFRKCYITDMEMEDGEFATLAKVTYSDRDTEKTFEGVGNGPINTVQRGMEDALGIQIKVLGYSEHALVSGSDAEAVSYIRLVDRVTGRAIYGVGISSNIIRASVCGIFSAVNRLFY